MPGQETDEVVNEKLAKIAVVIMRYKESDNMLGSSFVRESIEKQFQTYLYTIHPTYLNTVFEKDLKYEKINYIVKSG